MVLHFLQRAYKAFFFLILILCSFHRATTLLCLPIRTRRLVVTIMYRLLKTHFPVIRFAEVSLIVRFPPIGESGIWTVGVCQAFCGAFWFQPSVHGLLI